MTQLFGFTEHAIYTNLRRVHAVEDLDAIGQPFAHTKTLVVDRDGRALPDGFDGELVSLGVGVARGYAGDEADGDDQRAFKLHKNGANAFYSGDLCRRRADDDELRFLGRRDDRVKIRGNIVHVSLADFLPSKIQTRYANFLKSAICNLETRFSVLQLGDVECALSSIAGVRASAVVTRRSQADEPLELIAFIDGEKGAASALRLKAALERLLPSFALPRHVCTLTPLPCTSNGKVDRRQLERLAVTLQNDNDDDEENRSVARTKAESNQVENVLDVFRQFLGNVDYQLHDDMFAAGADSLRLLRIAQALEQRSGVRVDVRAAFRARTAADWLQISCERAEESDRSAFQPSKPATVALVRGPATFNQEHVWLERELSGGDSAAIERDAYWLFVELEFGECIDTQRLNRALRRIVAENESLRTRLVLDTNGSLEQIVEPSTTLATAAIEDTKRCSFDDARFRVCWSLDKHENADNRRLRLGVDHAAAGKRSSAARQKISSQ